MTPDEHNPEGTDHAAQGHALAASKPTPPAIHRITPGNPPQPPCWVFDYAKGDANCQQWWWCRGPRHWQYAADGEDTHWMNGTRDKRPTVTPDAPTPPALPQESAATRDDLDDPQFCGLPPWPRPPSGESRVLPGPVWNALTNAATKIEDVALRQRFLVEAEKCLAPLWPRPAAVTADARELAERIHKAVFAGESHPDAEKDAIAAVLAPVLAELERQRAGNRDLLQWVGCKMLNAEWDSFKQSLETIEHWKARAEAAERRVFELEAARRAYAKEFPDGPSGEPDVGSIHANIRSLVAERDDLRAEVEILTYRHAEAGWWSPATVKAYEKQISDLRAEVLRLQGIASTNADQLATAERVLDAYRVQLAEAKQEARHD